CPKWRVYQDHADFPDGETAGRCPLVLREFGLPHGSEKQTGSGLDRAGSRKAVLPGYGSNPLRIRSTAAPCPAGFPAPPVPAESFPPPAAALRSSPDNIAAHWGNIPREAGNEAPQCRRSGWQPSWEAHWNNLFHASKSS